MAIRVTQNTMYDKMTSQMQKSLAAYMESKALRKKRSTGHRMILLAHTACW